MSVVVPGFILSELRTGFQMGFLLFIPFILIDFVVAIVLMSLGLLFLQRGYRLEEANQQAHRHAHEQQRRGQHHDVCHQTFH